MPTFEIMYVDVYEGGGSTTRVVAPTARDAEKKFEADSDGVAIVYIKEVEDEKRNCKI